MSTLPPVSSQISGPVVPLVNFGVRRVVELLRNPGVGRRGGQLLGLGDGALHAVLGRCEHEVRAQRPQQRPPLDAHRLGHGKRQRIALGRGHERQGDARVAAGRLNDVRVGRELARLLGRLDHRPANAVLYAAARVEELQLRQHRRAARRHDAVELDQRRVVRGANNIAICLSVRHAFTFHCWGIGSLGREGLGVLYVPPYYTKLIGMV